MPRPGPRPYECIRRAWHSDCHQPLRGALIQEIFRIVNELHSISTRRKKEWQEKLPIVVLRAEEILYSKANSESEYAVVDTLRNRLEDAVNTMIRRDESEEEGLYLPPCVEAALSLGCTPKKVPRGQRQISLRLLQNGTRPNGTMCAINNGNCKGISGKGRNDVKSAHDCLISSQRPQMQDHGFFSTALPMGGGLYNSPGGLALGPLACYAPSLGLVFPQNFLFPTSFEALHSSITQSLPQLGGLVQFLKSADPSADGGGPFETGSFPMQGNVNHDSRALQYVNTCTGLDAQVDAHFICRDSNGSVCITSTGTPPATSLPRSTLSRNVGSERDQLVNFVGAMAPCIAEKMMPRVQQIAHRPDLFSMNTNMQQIAAGPDSFSTNPQMQSIAAGPDISSRTLQIQGFSSEHSRWQACQVPKFKVFPSPPSCYRASSLQRGMDLANGNSDDLQLRLGPPGIEATNTAGLSCDPSASKRLRVEHDALDGRESKQDRVKLYGLALPQQLTGSRC